MTGKTKARTKAAASAQASTTQMMPFIDLAAQQARLRPQLEQAISRVLDHGAYIMGPEIAELEAALAAFTGARFAISTSSGTDALMLALMGLGLAPGEAVIVPSFTFAASAEVLPCLGAVPVFAEVEETSFNLDPSRLDDAMAAAELAGLRVAGIIPVGLFGQPADMTAISAFAERHGLWVLDDAAQSLGASWQGRQVGTMGQVTATSFFPAKPLGCYGDGGAVFTDDPAIAEVVRSARIHGMGRTRYLHDRIGMTARMDTIQAAVLLEKLKIFSDELVSRQRVAETYNAALAALVEVPRLSAGATSSWAQYCIRLPATADRDSIQQSMRDSGIPTAIYYPLGMHQQQPYQDFPVTIGGLGLTETLCRQVLALPMHPYLDDAAIGRVVAALRMAV